MRDWVIPVYSESEEQEIENQEELDAFDAAVDAGQGSLFDLVFSYHHRIFAMEDFRNIKSLLQILAHFITKNHASSH